MPQQSSRRGALKGIITAAILAMGGSFLCHMLHCRIRWLEFGAPEDDCSLHSIIHDAGSDCQGSSSSSCYVSSFLPCRRAPPGING